MNKTLEQMEQRKLMYVNKYANKLKWKKISLHFKIGQA